MHIGVGSFQYFGCSSISRISSHSSLPQLLPTHTLVQALHRQMLLSGHNTYYPSACKSAAFVSSTRTWNLP